MLKKVKTTKQHFSTFVASCKFWQEKLGLTCVSLYFEHKKLIDARARYIGR